MKLMRENRRKNRRTFPPRPRRISASSSDERLVEAIREGDHRAIDVMVARYRDRLLAYCTQILRSRADAEDVTQQALVSAIDGIRRSEDEITLRPWLYRIAHNASISALRKRRPVADQAIEDLELPASADLGSEVRRREELSETLVSLQRLPDEQRAALVLSELEDMSGKQVGQALGCTPDRVRNLIYQARQSLLADREATDMACLQARETLASWRGRPDRVLRRHLELCDGCRGYRERVRTQRAALSLLIPVPPARAFAQSTDRVIRERFGSPRRHGPLRLKSSTRLVLGAAGALVALTLFAGTLGAAVHVSEPEREATVAASGDGAGAAGKRKGEDARSESLISEAVTASTDSGAGTQQSSGQGGRPDHGSPQDDDGSAPPSSAPPATSPPAVPAEPPPPPDPSGGYPPWCTPAYCGATPP